jgi:FkbM family methyltransferase
MNLFVKFTDDYYLRGLPNLLFRFRKLFKSNDGFYFDPNGIKVKLDLDNYFQNNIRFGYYEYSVRALIKLYTKESDLVLDIGGNIGYMSLLFANIVGKKGKVFCFEPNPELIPVLHENVLINDFKNIEVINAAVGNIEGEANFYCGFEHSLSTMITGSEVLQIKKTFKVPVVTIDHYLKKNNIDLSKVKFVKIDVEGFEYNVLKGMMELIQLRKSMFIIESNPPAQKPLGIDLEIILKEFFFLNGYKIFWIESKSNKSFFYKKKLIKIEIDINNVKDFINRSGDFFAQPN